MLGSKRGTSPRATFPSPTLSGFRPRIRVRACFRSPERRNEGGLRGFGPDPLRAPRELRLQWRSSWVGRVSAPLCGRRWWYRG